jgi:hypothetical protein
MHKFVGSWCLDSKDDQAAIYKKRPQPGDCQFAEDRSVYARTALIPLKADVF